ncbi:UDP-N-acetylmuramate--L-alanine ligase [candidate division WOR-3 bacterium]|nr:UDP-N-acetylmuramate--L-alanine ligase [candidate division WOR-3 bacterium]
MFGRVKHIHMVGIGGIGVSGLAYIIHNLGFEVAGSDLKSSEITERLKKAGIRVEIGHKKENLKEADVLVISSAIPRDNPEITAARERGIPIIGRGEMLGELMRMKYAIAVSGTHGKTTTSSVISLMLELGELDPTSIIGGKVVEIGSNAKLGASEYMVAEADESDRSFLHLYPTIAVVTNIEPEHLDYYENFDDIKACFKKFVEKIPFYGLAVLCGDDPGVRDILPKLTVRHLTYGFDKSNDISPKWRRNEGWKSRFVIDFDGRLYEFELNQPGDHNILNALAAIAVGRELKVHPAVMKDALARFKGIGRRMEKLGEIETITFIDDYGHHPTEIEATLASLRMVFQQQPLRVLFQPHRYSRIKYLHEKFGPAFTKADEVVITEIYPASEKPIPGVGPELIEKSIKEAAPKVKVRIITDPRDILDYFEKSLEPGDVFLSLGAGDVFKIGKAIFDVKSGKEPGELPELKSRSGKKPEPKAVTLKKEAKPAQKSTLKVKVEKKQEPETNPGFSPKAKDETKPETKKETAKPKTEVKPAEESHEKSVLKKRDAASDWHKDLKVNYVPNLKGKFLFSVEIAPYTTFNIGGPVEAFVEVEAASDLTEIAEFLATYPDVPFQVLGGGSNVVYPESFDGVVIKPGEAFSRIRQSKDRVYIGAGAKLTETITKLAKLELGGMEFLFGIPGSIGGAVKGNAGAFGHWVSEAVEAVYIFDLKTGSEKEIAKADIEWSYRSTSLPKWYFITEVAFKLQKTSLAKAMQEMARITAERQTKHPKEPSAGCVFVNPNPPKVIAGKMIEELGFKGKKSGGAMVSQMHANFIVNTGNATQKDVVALIREIKAAVKKSFSIDLHEEIKIITEKNGGF